MGIIIRQSIKNSVVTYIGVIIGTINVLFLYNKFLTSEQLGLYTALTSFSLVFASLAHLGTPHVGVRFFSRFVDGSKYEGFFSYLIFAPLLGFLAFTIIYWISNDTFIDIYNGNSPLLINYYSIIPIITFCLLYQLVLESYCRVHFRIVVPAIIRELFLKLSNSVLALLYGFKFITFSQLIDGIVLINFLALIFLCIYIKGLARLYIKPDFGFVKKPVFKEMIKYGLWTMVGGATATALPHLEKIMLPAYEGGLNKTAIFNIALSIGMVIAIPRNAIASISEPLLAASWKDNDINQIGSIYKKSALNLLIVGIFLFLGIWCNIDSIFAIIPNSEVYRNGKTVVLLVGLYSVVDMATGLNSEILRNSKYYKLDFSFYLIRFVVLILANLILIPLYSYNGAAFAMLLSIILYNAVKFLFIKNKWGLQPFDGKMLKISLLGLGTYIVIQLLSIESLVATHQLFYIIFKSIIIITIYGGGVYYFKFSEDINKQIDNLLKVSLSNWKKYKK